MANLFLSNSDWLSDSYKKSFWYNGEILKKGLPREDILFADSNKFYKEVCKFYGVEEDRVLCLDAQVYGKYNTTPYDKLKLDLTYIETYSLKLDLKLLMLTFKILFQKENTEGLEVWQRTAGQENKNKDSREL